MKAKEKSGTKAAERGVNMNEVIKAMLERRSIRKFKKELPKREDIEAILEAGLYAANGKGRQQRLS